MITKDNIEAYLLDYIEGNLSDLEFKEMEDLIRNNPHLSSLMQDYDPNFRLTATERIRFENKDALLFSKNSAIKIGITAKKKTKKKLFIPIYIKQISYAASFILVCFLGLYFLLNKGVKDVYISRTISDTKNKTYNQRPIISELDIVDSESKIQKNRSKIQKNKIKNQFNTSKIEENIINEEKIVKEKEEIEIFEASLIAYEVDNLVSIINDNDWEKTAYIVQNKEIKKGNDLKMFLSLNYWADKLKENIDKKIEMTKQDFGAAIALWSQRTQNRD